MAEPRESLERVVIQLEATGETDAANQVKGFLAELDKPKPAPVKKTTTKTKED